MDCPDTLYVAVGNPIPPVIITLAQYQSLYSATDNCGLVASTWTYSNTVKPGATTDTIVRNYSVADSCGLTVSCEHIIIVNTDAQLTMTCPSDIVRVECWSDVPPAFADYNAYQSAGGSASSLCGINTGSFRLISQSSNGNICPEYLTRLYEIADNCGNLDTCEHIIEIWDKTAPEITCPPDLVVTELTIPEPLLTISAFLAAKGTIDEYCGIEFFIVTESEAGSNPKIISRTYTVIDSCGNKDDCTQRITVYSNAEFECPPPVTVCQGNVPAHAINIEEFLYQKGKVKNYEQGSLTWLGDFSDGKKCPETIERRYSIKDNAGNPLFCSQFIYVDDTENPIASRVLPDIGISVTDPDPVYTLDEIDQLIVDAGVTDNCEIDKTFLKLDRQSISANGCQTVKKYIYELRDLCGNPVFVPQQITISEDTQLSVFRSPAPRTDCKLPALYTYDTWRAAGGILLTSMEVTMKHLPALDEMNGDWCDGTYQRTYEFRTACGTTTWTETINLKDEFAPVFTQQPKRLTTECLPPPAYATYQEFVAAEGLATDNCGLNEGSFQYVSGQDIVLKENCPRILVRTYEIFDNCGLRATMKDTLTIIDTTAPTAQKLADLDPVDCYEDRPSPDISIVNAMDNCGGPVTVSFVSDTGDPGCSGVVVRTYRITDICGNSAEITQHILIDFKEKPVVLNVPVIPDGCVIPVPYADYNEFIAAGGLVQDRRCNQSPAPMKFEWVGPEDVADGGTCPKTYTRTYRITDECGNDTLFTQLFRIDDKEAPVIPCLADISGISYKNIPAPFTTLDAFIAGVETPTDNCGIETYEYKTVDSSRVADIISITRIYVVTDFCGNADTCEHHITAIIDEDFALFCPQVLTGEVDCYDNLPPPLNFDQFIADGGDIQSYFEIDTSSFRMLSQLPENIICFGNVTRIYQIKNVNGDSTQCEQVFTVNDRLPPVITCPPTVYVTIGGTIPSRLNSFDKFIGAGGTASDNCELRTTGVDYPFFSESPRKIGLCSDTIVRTYRVYDLCNKDARCEHYIIILKDVPYQFTCPPLAVSAYECINGVPAPYQTLAQFRSKGGIATSDGGIKETSFTHTDEAIGTCPTIITRTYSVEDNCGNLLECTQTFTVHDKTAPVLTCPPAITGIVGTVPLPYPGYAQFIAAKGKATDNCAVDQASFRFVSDESDGQLNPITITRTYEIADFCGNPAVCTQTIVVYTNPELYLTCPPPDTVSCPDDLPVEFKIFNEFVAAGGSASADLPYKLDTSSFKLKREESDGNTCPEIITRTYSIRNSNGDYKTCDHLTIIHDTIKPTLVFNEKIVECGNGPFHYYDVQDLRNSGRAVFDDNCGWEKLRVELVDTDSTGVCPLEITRIYQLTDDCNNQVTATEVTIVIDTRHPAIFSGIPDIDDGSCVLPSPLTKYEQFLDLGGFVIDCSDFVMTWEKDSFDAAGVVHRFYVFTDICGNDTTHIQKLNLDFKVTVFDSIGPLCQNSIAPTLLSTSVNGIIGTWAPATISTSTSDSFVYLFTPVFGQCATPFKLTVQVTPEIKLTANYVNAGPGNKPTGMIDLTAAGGTGPLTFNWNNGKITEDISGLSAGSYTVIVTDSLNCQASLTIALISEKAELVMDCPDTLMLGCFDEVAANPPYQFLSEYLAAGGKVLSNCGIDTTSFKLVANDTVPGDYCLNIVRIYSISDSCGLTENCLQYIIVNDTTPPVIQCPDNSNSECIPENIGNIETIKDFIAAGGSISDNCSLDTASFTVDKIITALVGGKQIVTTFSVKDWCGNESTCVQTMISTDTIPPVAACISIEVYLGDSGIYRPDETDVKIITSGSTDNCTLPENLTFELIPSEVNCADVESGVELLVIVKDEAGNVDSCYAHISVMDSVPPVAICRNDTVYIDETGHASITAAQINNGSWDNCTVDTLYLSKYDFDCSDVGVNQVTLTVVDAETLRDSCVALVTVLDTLGPYVTCKDSVVIQLDENAEYTIQVNELYQSSYDVCGIDTMFVEPRELNCDHIGKTIIKLWAVDANGDSAYCESLVTIYGNIAPTVVDDSARTAENIPVVIDIITNDYDEKTSIDISTLSIEIKPLWGIAEIDSITGDVLYTPNPNYSGVDVLKYRICDDGIPCDPECGKAFVYIVVEPTNQPPVAVDDYYTIDDCDMISSNNVTDNDNDESGDVIFMPVLLDSVDHGQITVYADGSFDYIPNEGFVGIDSFKYEIYDVGIPSLSDTAWVYIDVYCTEENPDPMECELFVPEGFSPNGDGIHDFFRVMCIHLYPDAVMRIFNRNGNLLWMKENYGNYEVWGDAQNAWWWGNTDYQWDQGTRAVPNQQGKIVKVSNYVWVLDLGNGEIRNGTVMVAY